MFGVSRQIVWKLLDAWRQAKIAARRLRDLVYGWRALKYLRLLNLTSISVTGQFRYTKIHTWLRGSRE